MNNLCDKFGGYEKQNKLFFVVLITNIFSFKYIYVNNLSIYENANNF